MGANRIEVETFVRWRRYSEWSLRSTLSADKTHRGHTLKRCFALWLDEFIRMQNERQWAAIRARKQSLLIAKEKEERERAEEMKKKQKQNKTQQRSHVSEQRYLSAIISPETTPQNLFFPYYDGTNGGGVVATSKAKPQGLNMNTRTAQTDDRLDYVKHCELESILIPMYDSSMQK